MTRPWSWVAAGAMLSLAAAASAQTPLSPSGAVNSREAPSIAFPSTPPSPPAPPSPAPGETARTPADNGMVSRPEPALSAAPAAAETGTAAAPPPERESTARRASRPPRSPRSRGDRQSGDNVADMLNARELRRIAETASPVPVARPIGPPPPPPQRVVPPPPYGPPPGYGPPPYPPPVMMRPPY